MILRSFSSYMCFAHNSVCMDFPSHFIRILWRNSVNLGCYCLVVGKFIWYLSTTCSTFYLVLMFSYHLEFRIRSHHSNVFFLCIPKIWESCQLPPSDWAVEYVLGFIIASNLRLLARQIRTIGSDGGQLNEIFTKIVSTFVQFSVIWIRSSHLPNNVCITLITRTNSHLHWQEGEFPQVFPSKLILCMSNRKFMYVKHFDFQLNRCAALWKRERGLIDGA